MKTKFCAKWMGLLGLVGGLALVVSSARASIIAYDPMSYSGTQIGTSTAPPSGTPTITTGGGFTGNWVGGALTYSATTLTYTSLPTSGGSLANLGANYLYEKINGAPTTGTVFVSFIYKQSGDNGGNRCGIIMENSSGSGFMFAYHQSTGSQGFPSIDLVSGTTTSASGSAGTELGDSGTLRTYTTANFYVVKFTYTSGVVSRIDVYSNPTAGQPTAPAADFSITSGLGSIGQLVNIGFIDPTTGEGAAFDEFRVGTTFADAVGTTAAPSAPTGVTATAGTSQVALSWTAVSGATSYNVLSSTTSGSGYTALTTAGAQTTTTYTDTTPANGTPVYYVVQAVSAGGTSVNSSQVSATPMAAPTGLGATPGNNSVALTWTGSTGATGYNVKRSSTSGSGYNILAVGANVSGTSFTDSTAVGGNTYYYVVSATNTVGESVNSSQVSATPTLSAPLPPSGLSATPSSGQVFLGWTAGAGATSYNVKRSTTSGSEVTISAAGTVTGTSYTDSTAGNGNIYYYEVSSTNSVGESANSSEVTANMPPAAPTGLGATPGANQVSLSWTPPGGLSGATSYTVKRSTTSGAETNLTTGVSDTTYTDSTAISGTTYYYEVVGVNASGAGSVSSETSATPTGAPQAPTGLTAIAGSSSIALSWTAAQGAPTSYNVLRSTTSGSGYVALSTNGTQTTTSFTDAGVAPGTTYYYVVSAVNTYGTSANSSQASASLAGGLVAYDPMSYSGSQINTGTASPSGTPTQTTGGGFTGNWAGGALTWNSTGLTYASLPTTGGSISQLGANNLYEKIASAPTSGSVYVSFLFQQSGDNGGNRSGVILENSSGTGVMFAYHQNSSSQGFPALESMSGTTTVGSELGDSTTLRTYATPNLYVLKFTYTSGVVSSISVYSNPTAGQGTAPSADFTVSSGLPSLGALVNIGLVDGSAEGITLDEFRVGPSFGSVVGASSPTAPTGVSASPGNNQVILHWTAVSGATSYTVLRSTVSGVEEPIATGVTGTTYTDSTAVNGTTYYYEIQAVNGVGNSAFSTEVSATPSSPPPAPTGVSATPGVNSVSLNWTASAGATSYNVKRSTTSGAEVTITPAGSVTGTTYTDNTAVGGTTYYYVISATNSIGESANSTPEVSATPTIALPSPPTGLSAAAANSQVTLNWTAGSGATSYNVKRSTTSGAEATISAAGTVTGTSYLDSSAADGNIYYYEVSSTNAAGESANSSEVTATMPPAAPTGLNATAGSNQVSLSWTASAGPSGATSYTIKRSTTSGAETTLTSGVSGTSYTDSTAISGTTYYYEVVGVNGSGAGATSSEASATPTGAPQAPTGLTAAAGSSSIVLNWTAALGAPASYNVKRSTTSGSGYITLTTAGAQTTTSFTDSGVAPGTTYYYVVSAVNTYGESANSSQASASLAGGLIAYDPMSYSGTQINTLTASPTGTPTQITGGGFTGDWQGGALTYNATSLTYPSLPTAGGSLSSLGANDMYETLSGAPSSGTVWVSFLFKQGGDNGGNRSGVIMENSSGTGVMLAYQQAASGQGYPCLVTMNATTGVAGQLSPNSSTLQTYANNNLFVLKFTYTGGVVSSISVYSNPTAGQGTAPTPDFTVSSGLPSFGALVNMGLVDASAEAITIDEFRVGSSFASVVGLSAPSAPTGVSAAAGNNQVTLNWTAASGATSYTVLRSTVSGAEQPVATGVTGVTYTDSTAVNGTTYYYEVQAVSGAGNGPFSSEVSATPNSPPSAPTGVTATPGVNSVTLNWTASAGATSYNVKRSTTSGAEVTTTPAGSVTGTTYTDSTAVGGTTYFYEVSATNTFGESANSSPEVSATPTIALPSPPSGVSATPANSQVTLNWTAGSGAASYNVKRSTTSGAEVTISAAGTVTGTSYVDASAVDGSIYYYEVSSTNAAGESANSSEVTADMPPAAPTGLNATAGANQVSLSWTASAGPSGATTYTVLRSTTSGGEMSLASGVSGTSYNDTTALSGTTYYYEIVGVNGSGSGAVSSEASATPTGPPQAPTGVTVTTNFTSLTLNWTAALGAPVSYNVKRSTTSGAETTITPAGSVTGTTYTDSSVTVGTTYFYEISATNSYGESANSSEVAGKAPGMPLGYEPFNYPLGALANGTASTGIGFTGAWTVTGSPNIVAGSSHANFPSTYNALQTTGGNQYESLSTSINTGTTWISFLFQQTGDNGGNRSGLELLDGSGNGVMFAYHQFGGTTGFPSLDSVTGYTGLGAELGASSTPQTYNTANLYVLKVTYTSGVISSIAVYSNPTAGQNTAPTPDFTVTSGFGSMGAIAAIGMWDASGEQITVDEWNVGTSFGAVVGATPLTTPVANPAYYTRVAGLSLMIKESDLLTNASDADSYPLTLGYISPSTNGTALFDDGTYIYYTNSAPNNVDDSFQYYVSDGFGNDATNTVFISIDHTQTGQQSPQISVSGNSTLVTFFGVPGYLYDVERNTNLSAGAGWVDVTNVTTPAGGVFTITDWFNDIVPPGTSPPASAYYRLLVP